MANINKTHFWVVGSCAVGHSVISRSSLGGRRESIREVKEKGILRKSIFDKLEGKRGQIYLIQNG
jgi:hypothetical protein